MTYEELFWAKVDKTETCWLWTASVGWKPTIPHVPGSLNGEAKLTESQVREIRNLYTGGRIRRAGERGLVTVIELADQFQVSTSQIKRIVNNQSWRHI